MCCFGFVAIFIEYTSSSVVSISFTEDISVRMANECKESS